MSYFSHNTTDIEKKNISLFLAIYMWHSNIFNILAFLFYIYTFMCCSTQYIMSKQAWYLPSRRFLGAAEKLRKATISFIIPVRMEQLGSH